MDQLIETRLRILEESGEISAKVAEAVAKFLNLLEKQYSFTVTEENGAMFVTHTAVALSRIDNGETIEAIDPALQDEARATQYWDELPGLLSELEQQAGFEIPEQERGYLALHLTVMLSKAKGGEDN